ncbi:MAG: peptide deformylase [Planctomycetes bacterium]|jgi:peptide deformylase|nr:peptide deformylase [Planctomycetota bacterium]
MAKLLTIIINPDPILRKKSENIKIEEIKKKDFLSFILDMEKTMLKKDGIGLAAPQIGRNIRLIVVKNEGSKHNFFMINPKVTQKSWAKEWGEEGCLSVPLTFGKVERHKKLTCTYLDPQGKQKTLRAEGILARVIQHEVDHLDAILFIDKAKEIRTITEEEQKSLR